MLWLMYFATSTGEASAMTDKAIRELNELVHVHLTGGGGASLIKLSADEVELASLNGLGRVADGVRRLDAKCGAGNRRRRHKHEFLHFSVPCFSPEFLWGAEVGNGLCGREVNFAILAHSDGK